MLAFFSNILSERTETIEKKTNITHNSYSFSGKYSFILDTLLTYHIDWRKWLILSW